VPYDTGIADRLRGAGLAVVEVAGWKSRGSASFEPRGSVDHHTVGPRAGNAPSLNICTNGRSDLPGPLCHVLMGRDNTCYVIAAGRANHAGTGGWRGLSGNSSVYGIERENVGTPAEPWRPDQTDAAAKAHAALIRGRAGADMVCRHAEWTPRKIDTHSVSGPDLRARVQNYLSKAGGTVPPLPSLEDNMYLAQRPDGRVYVCGGGRRFYMDTWTNVKVLVADYEKGGGKVFYDGKDANGIPRPVQWNDASFGPFVPVRPGIDD